VPEFGSYDPGAWGWLHGPSARVVPFSFDGHDFPGGVAAGTERYFASALDMLVSQPGFSLPTSRSLDSGMWGYEDRAIAGTSRWSFHAYGLALDVCAPWNPARANPPAAGPHRLPANTGQLIRPLGMEWGGDWGSSLDWMHIELHLTPSEVQARWGLGLVDVPLPFPAAGQPAWPLPGGYYYGPYDGPESSISGSGSNDEPYRAALSWAQGIMGASPDGYYGPETRAATVRWQLDHQLEPDGLIGPLTWASLGG
jgi:peptidoglycan hydrolase-like protein with peptidoglycan-binding domain